MPDDIRELLQDRAEQVRLDPSLPDRVRARARRRRVLVSAGGGLLAVALAVGTFAGVRLIGRGDVRVPASPDPEPSVVEPTPSATPPVGEAWPGVWPERTREEAEAAQACADAGDERCTWRIGVEEFLENFGVQALGFSEVGFDEGLDLGEPDGEEDLTVRVTDCPADAICFGGRFVQVTVERLVRKDATGVWSVTGMGQVRRFTDAICGYCPATDHGVRQFVLDFLERRQFEVGAEAYLAEEALAGYRAHAGGLVLYAYEAESYGEGFDVLSVTADDDGTWSVEVELYSSTDDGDVYGARRELLVVDDVRFDQNTGYWEFIILGAGAIE